MRHPEVASAKANRDFVMKQMSEAVNAISGATQATGVSGPHPLEAPGALATALDDFDVSVKFIKTGGSQHVCLFYISHGFMLILLIQGMMLHIDKDSNSNRIILQSLTMGQISFINFFFCYVALKCLYTME